LGRASTEKSLSIQNDGLPGHKCASYDAPMLGNDGEGVGADGHGHESLPKKVIHQKSA
jgi:hypothetical protein